MSVLSLVLLTTLGHPSSAAPRPKPVELVGQVRAAASGPGGRARVLLVTKDAAEHELHTAATADHAELERLAGVRVRIKGISGDPRIPRGRHVLVDGYEIVDVGEGVVPELGTVAELELNGKPRLLFVNDKGQAALLPKGWATKMRRHVGAKLWMVGKRKGAELRPTRFAILRAAAR